MTPKEFFDKVVEMRRCQKEYFKNKRQIDLRISKQIEREVDEEILRKNAKEGDKIFDSHLGSGSSRIAAYGLGFDFYATEIDEEYFEAQEKRFHRECFGEIKTERGTLVQTNLFDK